MSQNKVFQPPNYNLAKKRNCIRNTVDCIYIFLILLSIVFGGINQNNDTVVGWILIIMGIISIPYAIFHICIYINGWKPLFWYDTPEYQFCLKEKEKKEDIIEYKILCVFVIITLILFSIILPILGISKLF